MQTINIVVTDFLGREYSTFIEAINEFYAEPPYNQETLGSFARMRIAPRTHDEVQLRFVLVPPATDVRPEAEAMWEIAVEGASALVFGIPGNDPHAYAEAAQLLRQFRTYQDLPLVAVTYDADHLSEDTIQLALGDPEHCRITYFAPEEMAVEVIVRDVVIAIIHHSPA